MVEKWDDPESRNIVELIREDREQGLKIFRQGDFDKKIRERIAAAQARQHELITTHANEKEFAALTQTLVTPPKEAPLGNLLAGKYRILEEIGHGGMGIVYKAEDIKLKRTVALKFLPPELRADQEARERFLQEARAAAALSHPNVCTIYEVDESEAKPFIAMEYVEGEDLREKIKKGPLSIAKAIDIAIQAADGLEKAHQKGIVHRDIKNANIMVTDAGQAKVMDFGLAKLRGGMAFTKEGTTLGTVAYMSPEQARGEEVDFRTDIWSLGVVLYQSLTGQMPFKGEHDQVVLHSILHTEPQPLRNLRAGIPTDLEAIVIRALEKRPSDRYQSVGEMLRDLREIKKGVEAGAIEEGLSWPRILLKRGVPQTLGLYILISLGILQLVKWLVNRFILSPHLPDFSLAALLSLVPTVLLVAYFHGRPGSRRWARAEKIGIPANLLVSAIFLLILFNGKSLGAATTTVTLKNEDGRIVERVVPKSEFVKSVALFFFDNRSGDPSQNWAQYAIPFLLQLDLIQDLFLLPNHGYFLLDNTRSAGSQDGLGMPLSLKRKIAQDLHYQFFVSGAFSKEGEELVLQTSIFETKRAVEIAKKEFRGKDIFNLIDEMSLMIRRDLGIPEQYIRDEKNLPVSETVTASSQALKSYIEGINAKNFERNWGKALRCYEQAVTEDPTFAYVYYDIQKCAIWTNQREKAEQAFKSLMQNLYKLPERVQYLLKSEYYAFKEDKDKQIAVLKMMAELSPRDILSHLSLRDIYIRGNQLDEALVESKRLLEIVPGQKDVLLGMGSLYERKGEPKEALKYYEIYAAEYPREVKSFAIMGDLYRTLGDYERAKSYYEKALLIEPESISTLTSIANIECDLGNFEGSEKLCQEALANAKTPEDRIAVYGSLSSALATQARFRKSLEYVRLIHDEEKKIYPPFLASLYRINGLDTYIKAGQKDEAFKIAEEIKSQAGPPYNTIIPLVHLGLYIEAKDIEKATQALKDVDSTPVSSIFGDNRHQISSIRGQFYEMKGEYEQAISLYKDCLKIKPTDFGPYFYIGRCYRRLREFKKAEENFQKCLKTSPFDPWLHHELALLYIDIKDKKKALEHLNIALNIWKNADPGVAEVEDAKKKLTELEGS